MPGAFFIQIATRQSEAQLMAECALCGAVTYAPLAYAWQARSVSCSECGTRVPIGRDELMKLKAQAAGSISEIERLLAVG